MTVRSDASPVKLGPDMRRLGIIEQASIFIEDGTIRWVGPAPEFRERRSSECHILDGSPYVALPGFVDSHTHALFAGWREDEFALRAQGKTYAQIAERGGGILNTVLATRNSTKKELKRAAAHRLDEMVRHGTTTVEIKSGYGLDEDSEARLMEIIAELSREHYADVVPTFLGAHAIPPEYTGAPEGYVSVVVERMIPYIAKRHLATFCDIFCESGYFTLDQSRRILSAAQRHGLKLKVHADELAASGGSLLAADLKAVSADHLEHIDASAIEKLKTAGCVAVLLPGVSFSLHHAYAPARNLIDAGVPVAIATDFNPGSCMSYSMPLMMTIACTQMGMSPEEAITASTLNAAAALSLSDRIGSIEVGKQADIILCDIPNYLHIAYHFGRNHVAKVVKKGTVLEFS